MSSRVCCVLVLIAMLAGVGCRQPDGPMPEIQGEVSDRLEDITRDLMSAAGGDRQAAADLADDLSVFTERVGNAEARQLAERVAAAIAARKLTEQSAQTLANQLWIAVAGRQLSDRQVETLRNDVKALLVSVGATEQNAEAVAAQVVEVQKVVTTRNRRWYERL